MPHLRHLYHQNTSSSSESTSHLFAPKHGRQGRQIVSTQSFSINSGEVWGRLAYLRSGNNQTNRCQTGSGIPWKSLKARAKKDLLQKWEQKTISTQLLQRFLCYRFLEKKKIMSLKLVYGAVRERENTSFSVRVFPGEDRNWLHPAMVGADSDSLHSLINKK